MAVTIVKTYQGPLTEIATVTWGLDADTTATITHGLAAVPGEVYLTPTASGAPAAAPMLAVTSITATTVVVTKNAVAGSAAAGACTVVIKRTPR